MEFVLSARFDEDNDADDICQFYPYLVADTTQPFLEVWGVWSHLFIDTLALKYSAYSSPSVGQIDLFGNY